MQQGSQILPDIFADAILDLHVEGGVFRLTLAQAIPQADAMDPSRYTLMPKAVLLLTEGGFASLCDVVDSARKQMMERVTAQQEIGSSPNFDA